MSLTFQARLLKCKRFLKVKTKLRKLKSNVSESEHGLKILDQNQQDIVQHYNQRMKKFSKNIKGIRGDLRASNRRIKVLEKKLLLLTNHGPDELIQEVGDQGGEIMEIDDVGTVTSEERAQVPCDLVTERIDPDIAESIDCQVRGESASEKIHDIDPRVTEAIDPKRCKDIVPNGIVNIEPVGDRDTGLNKYENKHDPKLFRKAKVICERINFSEYLPVLEVSNEEGRDEISIRNNPGEDINIGRDCNPEIAQTIGEDEWKPLICYICSIALGNKADLDIHMKSHSVQYRCLDCDATFSDSEKCQEHIRTHALPPPKRIRCCVCSVTFSKNWSRKMHILNKHASHSLDCEKCMTIFNHKQLVGNKTNLDSHTKSHSNQFECTECDATLSDFEKTIEHIRIHQALPAPPPKRFRFTCCTCPKSFVKYKNLKSHILLKHISHNWNCEKCLEISKQKKCPEKLPATHSTPRKSQSPRCTKSFRPTKGLKPNQAQHSDAFNSDLCTSNFSDHSSLEDHLRKHFGGANPEKSNRSADDCPDVKFQPHGHLKSHKVLKPHRCSFCPGRFIKLYSLKRHEFRRHRTSIGSPKDQVTEKNTESHPLSAPQLNDMLQHPE